MPDILVDIWKWVVIVYSCLVVLWIVWGLYFLSDIRKEPLVNIKNPPRTSQINYNLKDGLVNGIIQDWMDNGNFSDFGKLPFKTFSTDKKDWNKKISIPKQSWNIQTPLPRKSIIKMNANEIFAFHGIVVDDEPDTGRQRSTIKPLVKIKNWSLTYAYGQYVLTGNAYGHPNFPDGRYVVTSKVIDFNFKNKEAETLNTYYILE